jgi:mono/diheme cytochrome c family protein
MKKSTAVSLLLTLITGTLLHYSCTETTPSSTKQTLVSKTDTDLVKRGEYLVKIAGCNDCHSPKRMGAQGPEIIPELMLSGYPSSQPVPAFDSKMFASGFSQFSPDLTVAAGPWGISFAANLTPDETGLGAWTEAQFKTALTKGKYKGLESGRMLLPPMPWINYTTMADEDIKAMFAYLQQIKPVKNLVPAFVSPDQM